VGPLCGTRISKPNKYKETKIVSKLHYDLKDREGICGFKIFIL
jgi:hypothetical protein